MAAPTLTAQVGVVIIDDAPRTLDNLKKLLAFESDIEVIGTAVTARAGIEQARDLKPDVVLMDVNLPDLDGIRATEILSSELPQTPVVIMSVQEDREYLRRAMQAGAREFLVKPFSADELVAAIRRVNQMQVLKQAAPAPRRPPPSPGAHPGPLPAGPAPAPRRPAPAPGPAAGGSLADAPITLQDGVPPSRSAAITAPFPPVVTAPVAAPPGPAVPIDEEPAAAPDPVPDEAPPAGPVFEKRRPGPAEVVLVFSGKGGVGKSVVAGNLAAAIGRETGEEVALVDLDLQFGDAAVLLGLEPKRTISDIVDHYPDVDASFVVALMLQAGEHLRVLPAPVSPELADLVTPEHVRATLTILKSSFDHVVLDCSSHLGDVTLDALEYADKVVLVSDFGIPAIKETKLALKLFESLHIDRERIFLVLNRAEAGSEISAEQIESNLRFPVTVQIPNRDRIVLSSISRGAPFVEVAPEADISQRMRELSAQLVELPAAGAVAPAPAARKRRFWARPAGA